MTARRSVAAMALAAGLLAGCSSTPAPPAAPPPAPATTPPTTAPATPTDPDVAACLRHEAAVGGVRSVIGAIEAGPVLPAAVALFLLGARQAYSTPGVADPELAAAMSEAAAAIDELDAQGRELLPEGGNATQDAVELDPTRIREAVAALEELCPDS
jgi:hypothetical protein